FRKLRIAPPPSPAPNNNNDDGLTMMEEGRMLEVFLATSVKPLKLVSYRAHEAFYFEIKLKRGGGGTASSLTRRGISLNKKSTSTLVIAASSAASSFASSVSESGGS